MSKKRTTKSGWSKPLACEAMAVHPSEISKAKELDRSLGLGDTTYTRDGSPEFRDTGEYNKYLKAHGMVNKTSGKGNHALCPSLIKRIQERLANP